MHIACIFPPQCFPAEIHISLQKFPAKSANLEHFPPKEFPPQATPAKTPIVTTVSPVEVLISRQNVYSSQIFVVTHFGGKIQAMCILRIFPPKCFPATTPGFGGKMRATNILSGNEHFNRRSRLGWWIQLWTGLLLWSYSAISSDYLQRK